MSETTQTEPLAKIPLSNVYIWTPSGEEVWSGRVYPKKAQQDDSTITGYQQWEAIKHGKQMGGFVPSAGLLYQTRAKLEKENPVVEEDFITGDLEDTATLWRYLKIGENWADGLLIQYPLPNEDGTDFLRDEKGIPKARQIFQMALPVRDSYVGKMPPELDMFANTLYGMQDTRSLLPDYAFVWVNPSSIKSCVEKRALRGGWYLAPRERRRVDVPGPLAPAHRHSPVSFRVFEGGEELIKDVDARRRRLIVETKSMEDAERYAAELRNLGIPFAEE